MAEPAYSFTIPSVHDDLPLDCRVYHPKHFDKVLLRASEDGHAVPGAVIAHPYAPMGGCYDDPVVLSVTKCLLKEGYMVGTFNFRYASGYMTCRNEVLCVDVGIVAHRTRKAARAGPAARSEKTTSLLQAL